MQAEKLLEFLTWVDDNVPEGWNDQNNKDFIMMLRIKIEGLKDRG